MEKEELTLGGLIYDDEATFDCAVIKQMENIRNMICILDEVCSEWEEGTFNVQKEIDFLRDEQYNLFYRLRGVAKVVKEK